MLATFIPTAASADVRSASGGAGTFSTTDQQLGTSGFASMPAPTITGTAALYQTLTANLGTWSPAPQSFYVEWLRDGRVINGMNGTVPATTSLVSYSLRSFDLGAVITVRVSALLNSSWSSRLSAPTQRVEMGDSGYEGFVDVRRDNLFYHEITWASYFRITRVSIGFDEYGNFGTWFHPLAPVKRDALAAFLYRLVESPPVSLPAVSPFIDVAPDNMFYKEIVWLAQTGISTGWDVGGGKREFRPFQPVARDAAAAFLFRLGYHGGPPPTESPFVDVTVDNPFITEITWMAESGMSTGWDLGDGTREFRPLQSINRDAMVAFLFRSGYLTRAGERM